MTAPDHKRQCAGRSASLRMTSDSGRIVASVEVGRFVRIPDSCTATNDLDRLRDYSINLPASASWIVDNFWTALRVNRQVVIESVPTGREMTHHGSVQFVIVCLACKHR
jgi:hypothetical protein